MTQQVRFIVFIAISVVILIGWQALFPPPRPAPKPPQAEIAARDAGAPPAPVAPAPSAELSAPPAGSDAPVDPAAPVNTPEAAEALVTIDTALWTATFTTKGGAVQAFELKGDKQSQPGEKGRKPVDLSTAREGGSPLVLVSLPPGDSFARGTWTVAERGESSLTFERREGALTLRKTYRWKPDAYALGIDVEVARAPGAPTGDLPLRTTLTRLGQPPSGGFFSGGQGDAAESVCHVAGTGRSVEKLHPGSEDAEEVEGTPGWIAVGTRYFVSALAPTGGTHKCAIRAAPTQVTATLDSTVNPAAGGAQTLTFDAYFGPKDVTRLEAAGHELKAAVDFGFFTVICNVLLAVMKMFQGVVGNWGIAIVLLTLLVKAITFPLTHKQMVSMEEMRRLAPKVEELKTKFAGDQNRVNQETMKLYQEHKVQPLGGCVPMLVQMPVWFALYQTLAASFDLHNEPFIPGWIGDLTAQDPFYVLPILMTVTMVLTQVLTPQPQQTAQMKYMTYGMPLFFGFIMLTLPAGLVLYIFTNNLLSIAQSLWFRRKYGADSTRAAAA